LGKDTQKGKTFLVDLSIKVHPIHRSKIMLH
jgi:hypothetical protein